MKKAAWVLGLLLATAPASVADGLEKGHISADARWVAHFDMSVFHKTTIFELLQQEGAIEELDKELQSELGMNPLLYVKSATLYGLTENPDDAIAIIRGTKELQTLVDRMRAEDNYRSIESNGLRMHAWVEDDGAYDAFGYVLHPEHGEDLLVVVGEDRDLVEEGARVLLGQRKSLLGTSDPKVTASPRPGSFLFVAAESLSGLSGFEPASAVAGLARGLVIDVGEQGDEMYIRAALETNSTEDATNVFNIVSGARSLIAIAGGQKLPQAARNLINALRIQANGPQVLVDFRYNVHTLLDDLKTLEEEH